MLREALSLDPSAIHRYRLLASKHLARFLETRFEENGIQSDFELKKQSPYVKKFVPCQNEFYYTHYLILVVTRTALQILKLYVCSTTNNASLNLKHKLLLTGYQHLRLVPHRPHQQHLDSLKLSLSRSLLACVCSQSQSSTFPNAVFSLSFSSSSPQLRPLFAFIATTWRRPLLFFVSALAITGTGGVDSP